MPYLVLPLVLSALLWTRIETRSSVRAIRCHMAVCASAFLQALFCFTAVYAFRKYAVIPVLAFISLGTVCFLVSAAVVIKVRVHRHLAALTAHMQGLRRGLKLEVYVRMLLYELVALFPAAVAVVPFEVAYPRIYSVAALYDGLIKRAVTWCECMALLTDD